MMKKVFTAMAALAMMAIISVPAMAADVTTGSDTCNVTLDIEKYCEIAFDTTTTQEGTVKESLDLAITHDDWATGKSDTATFKANANFGATVTGSMAWDADAEPVDTTKVAFTFESLETNNGNVTGSGTETLTFASAEVTGAVQMKIAAGAIDFTDTAGDYSGTYTISIAETTPAQ